ncbi:MAG: helicase-related protein [bacterium]|nr:helicase-related protein [bacterium]
MQHSLFILEKKGIFRYATSTLNTQGSNQYPIALIAGLTPEFLEKPALWWKKSEKEIIRKRTINPYIARNTAIVEKDAVLKQSEFLRMLSDIGYQKTLFALAKGTFLHKGASVILHAINHEEPIAIEFDGNRIADIRTYSSIEKDREVVSPVHPSMTHNFHEGDYVVHIDHGIGIFRKIENNYLVVEYASARTKGPHDRLFVPEEESKRLTLYLGLRTPAIHRLGTPLWHTTKKKAKEDIIAFARTLAALYKKRSEITRIPYASDSVEQEIWDLFPFDETPDQNIALEEIFMDLSRPEPMERLLTGDVGFGKTEVALRAILRVLLNGKQAAIIAPTTVLADQHAELFKKRFEKLPFLIERFTRLESEQKAKHIVAGMREGSVDLVIGTHRLLQKNISFKNLGLLLIDEEQRFGVRHKEFIKENYPAVDTLTLSATPIPRTLAFSLAGIRPLSELKEAPRGRIAPLSHVLPYSKHVIRDALTEEHKRGGQIYYLSNRIHHIPQILETLKTLAPHMRLGVIHGRLRENEIIKVMRDFRQGKLDILVSTTIIENGLDISTVNTLVVEDASLLGLAQAHQLRGRIGRGDVQSYAYFFYPLRVLDKKQKKTEGRITKSAERRLAILEELSYLGAGIEIAKRDLEMRGSGNILGKQQSGVANKIGWNLYFEMLAHALEEVKSYES